MKRSLTLAAVLAAALALAGCDLFESPSDPTSPPDGVETRWLGARLTCQDGTAARGVRLAIDNDYSETAFETVREGDDAGLAPPKLVKFEAAYFATDPPWKVDVRILASSSCGGPVSPQPTCVLDQTLLGVPIDWRNHHAWGEYFRADATIVCQ